MNEVVILIPAYNESSVIRDTVDKIPMTFNNIICVDDGSNDDTYNNIKKTRAKVVRHIFNLGQGAALQTAIDYALLNKNYKYFVTYDADGQHSIDDVIKMLNILKKEKLDIVLGSRFLGSTINMRKSKRLILKCAVTFSNIITGVKLTDTHNGLRVMNRHAAENMQLRMPDFSHATEIIERISEKKLAYKEAAVTISYTDYSKAKGQSTINAINILFDVILGKIVKK